MTKVLLQALLVLIPSMAFSQTDFKNGFVVMQSGDTVRGWVDYRESTRAHRICDFKTSLTSQSVESYTPKQISGYGFVAGAFFQSKIATRSDSTSEQVFFEVLTKGTISLYKLDSHFWIEKDGQGVHELSDGEQKTYVNGTLMIKKNYRFRGILNLFMFDCPDLAASVRKVSLNERVLVRLVGRYNACRGTSAIVYKENKSWFKPTAGLVSGINFSTIKFNAENFQPYDYLNGSFESYRSAMAGLAFNIMSPRLSERLSFHGSVIYMSSKYYQFTESVSGGKMYRSYVTVDFDQIKVPLGVRYTFPDRMFTPIINLGLSHTSNIDLTAVAVNEVLSGRNINSSSNDAFPVVKNNQFGVWGGVGVAKSINRKLSASIELRYERTDGITPFSVDLDGLRSSITNIQIIIGVSIK